MSVYFDTNVIRYLRTGLRDQPLADQRKREVVLSPISLLELVAQIACIPGEALGCIHDLGSWANTANLQLLDWSEVFIAHWVFGKDRADGISVELQRMLKVCYSSECADADLRDDARALSDFLEHAKRRKAVLLEGAVAEIRRLRVACTTAELRACARRGLAGGLRSRVGAVEGPPDDSVAGRLVAYFAYHEDLIERAARTGEFNFFKHRNDHFDAEQLVFLADPSLHFFTADTGYFEAARLEPRIHILRADQLQEPTVAPMLLDDEIKSALG